MYIIQLDQRTRFEDSTAYPNYSGDSRPCSCSIKYKSNPDRLAQETNEKQEQHATASQPSRKRRPFIFHLHLGIEPKLLEFLLLHPLPSISDLLLSGSDQTDHEELL